MQNISIPNGRFQVWHGYAITRFSSIQRAIRFAKETNGIVVDSRTGTAIELAPTRERHTACERCGSSKYHVTIVVKRNLRGFRRVSVDLCQPCNQMLRTARR